MSSAYRILSDLRAGRRLAAVDLAEIARAAATGAWSDAQLAAFLMGTAIRGLDRGQTVELTRAMLETGELWRLSDEFPRLADKHSTGGVGDTVSLVLAPLVAEAGAPIVMLTGRGLGHTAGTADKLEAIPGIRQELDRDRARRLLDEVGLALGIATSGIAPADRRLYLLRDHTATVESLPLIVASILSKKLATGAAAIVFDVKTGEGAFMQERERSRELARMLVAIASDLGMRASAVVSDMSQPLGDWSGHAAEVREALACLEGDGPEETVALTIALAREIGRLVGEEWSEAKLRAILSSGAARERFARWAIAQGAEASFFSDVRLPLAPVEVVLTAPRPGVLARVATRELGLLLAEAGGARSSPDGDLDRGIALWYRVRLGQRIEKGDELARIYLRRADPVLAARFAACFEIGDAGQAVPTIVETILAAES